MQRLKPWPLLLLLCVAEAATTKTVNANGSEHAAEGTAPAEDPAESLAALDRRVEGLGPIRYGAIRTTARAGRRTVERWSFVQGRKGSFRVDYSGDTARQIAYNGRVLTDYVPALRAARQYDMPNLSVEGQTEVLTDVFKHVFVPGVRIGADAADMQWKWQHTGSQPEEDPLIAIGQDDKGGELTVWLHPKHRYLLRSELRVNSRFIVSVDGRDHVEVQPGVWFPTHVELVTTDSTGEVRVEFSLARWTAGTTPDDSIFTLSLDESVSIERYP